MTFLLVFAACSSTNEITAQRSITEGAVDPGTGVGPGETASPGTSGSTRTVTTEGTRTAGGGAPVVPGGGPVRMGRGITNSSIKIGFNITKNLNAALAAVGFGGPSIGNDERTIINILVKHFNDHGGIAGRKIIPVIFDYDATQAQGWDALAEQACSRFVDDEGVFAATSGHVGGTDALLACLAEGQVPLMQQNQWPYDGDYQRRYAGYLYQPSRMRPERWVPQYFGALRGAGYFTPGHKLGLIRFDAPVFTRIEKMMRDDLASRGLKFTDISVIKTPQSVSQFSAMAGELSSTILQFRSKGITHVVFDEYAGIIPFFFLTQAEDQGFRPRYGFTSVNLMGTLELQHGKEQLHGALGVSWLPGQDLTKAFRDDPRYGKGGAFEECFEIIDAAGYDRSRLYDGTHCDSLFFLKQALERTNDLTVAGLQASAATLGTSYDSPYTWATNFGPGRTDGASRTMLMAFEDGCGCFKLRGGLRDAG